MSGLRDKQVNTHYAVLFLLIWFAGIIRYAVGVPYPYFTDIDVVNFGLAAKHFDLLQHQPHPPGYIGYVLFLKLVALFPNLRSIEIAKWGSRIMGTACVPAAWWACKQITGKADSRALWAAALVTFHPVLWYYGADGQSHSSEALSMLLLFGLAVRWKPDVTLRRLLVFCFLSGLAGAFRPTIVVTSAVFCLWLVWGQSWRYWIAGAAAGVVGIAAWWGPTVISVGGPAMYFRISDALIGELFLKNYSFLSKEATVWGMRYNLSFAAFAGLVIAFPLLARAKGRAPWRRTLGAALAVSLLFFAATFLSELGYVAGLCALACLVPATWPDPPLRQQQLRAALVTVAFASWFIMGPLMIHVPGMLSVFSPDLPHIRHVRAVEALYAKLICDPAHPNTLLLTDRQDNTLTRSVSFACPGLVSGTQMYKFVLRQDLDVWAFMSEKKYFPVPSKVPEENGPPTTAVLPWKFDRVLVGPGASDAFVARVRAAATCPPKEIQPYPDKAPKLKLYVYPVSCVARMKLSAHTIVIRGTGNDARPPTK